MKKVIEAITPVETFNLLATSLSESAKQVNDKTPYQADVQLDQNMGVNELVIKLTPKGAGFTTPLAQIVVQLDSNKPFEPYESAKREFIKDRNRRLCEANALLTVLIDAAKSLDDLSGICARDSLTDGE